MQRQIRFWSLVAAVLLSGSAAWAQGDFYVIAAGPTAVGTKITSVPYTISNPGFYYLAGNLTYTPMTGEAITINHNDVTLDLMGFSLFGPGSNSGASGIHMHGLYNMEVRNGTVAGFIVGIWEGNVNAANHRVLNIRPAPTLQGFI